MGRGNTHGRRLWTGHLGDAWPDLIGPPDLAIAGAIDEILIAVVGTRAVVEFAAAADVIHAKSLSQ
jgi:hypothetical protein